MRHHERRTTARPTRSYTHFIPLVAAAILLAACDGATEPGVATYIGALSPMRLAGTVASEITPAPVVRVTDQFYNPVQGMEIIFWTTGENGVPTNTSARTDANGAATVGSWRLTTRAGTQTLRAVMLQQSPAEAHEVLFVATANPAAAANLLALDTAHAAPAGGMVWLRVRVVDAFANPVSAAMVNFEIESGGGSLGAASAATNLDGIAHAQWAIGSGGENSVTASVAGLESVRFSATVLKPPFYFELQPSAGWIMPMPSWIQLGENSRFTTSVGGVAGGGEYTISGSSIVFKYSDDFLQRLGATFDWWGYPYAPLQEAASIAPGFIVVRRCASEDCWEADWTFSRLSAQP